MNLKSPNSGKEYEVSGPVYENEVSGIWCGTAVDETYGQVFVKIQNYRFFADEKVLQSVQKAAVEEAKSLKLANTCTRGVPKLYDSWNDRQTFRHVLIMQSAPGESLRSWMNRNKKDKLESKDLYVRTQIIVSICEVMRDIAGRYPVLVHRDLKPENIFIRFDRKHKRWKSCIIDFGCANVNYIRNVGTPAYQAPEQMGLRSTTVGITSKTDVFAIGQIFYELLLGEPQLIGNSYTFRSGKGIWMKRPELTSDILKLKGGTELNEILKKMTEFKPSDRIIYDKLITDLIRIQFR